MLLGEHDQQQERNLAAYYCLQWFSCLVLLIVVPRTVLIGGVQATFICLAVFNVLSLAVLKVVKDAGRSQSIAVRTDERGSAWMRGLALLGIGALFGSEGAVWTFLEIVGRQRGFAATAVDAAATGSAVFGILGCVAVVTIGRRYGQRVPMIVSACALAVSFACLTNTHFGFYVCGICLFIPSSNAFAAYQFGLATDFDKTGFTAAWASTTSLGGYAVGPAMAGLASVYFGADGIVGVAVVGTVLAFLIAAILLRRVPRRAPSIENKA